MGSLAGAYGTSKALQTTGSYLEAHIRDARLRAVLASQWGNYGLPPSRSAFALHAIIASHYMDGAYYPIDGASSIASAVKPIIEAAGGQVLVNHVATKILLEDNRAVGVRVVQQQVDPPLEKVFAADVIISGIGALLTYTKLLPTALQIPYRKEIERFPRGTSNVTVYVGFKDDPSRLGLKGENYWMYDSIDHDEVFESRNALIGGKARHCFLSFPSLKNPQASTHTAEIIAFVDPEPFVQWSSQPVKKRGQEYEHLKGRIADALLGFVDERIRADVDRRDAGFLEANDAVHTTRHARPSIGERFDDGVARGEHVVHHALRRGGRERRFLRLAHHGAVLTGKNRVELREKLGRLRFSDREQLWRVTSPFRSKRSERAILFPCAT